MKPEDQVEYESVLERMAHLVTHPAGQFVKSISARGYESARWELAKWWPVNRVVGNPMSQHFLLPFVVRKGDTVLDIGANVGQFTIPLASLVGPSGAVHSFEPISPTFSELNAAVKQNGVASQVKLCKFALGDSERSVDFTIPKDRLTEASAVSHSAEKWNDYQSRPELYFTETCKVVRLDKYLKENRIEGISFVKCDVEGGEFLVMKGAMDLLTRSTPPVLMMEIYEGWTKSFGYAPRDLIQFLEKEAAYECYWISPKGLKRVTSDDSIIPGVFYQWVDFLFVVPRVHGFRINVERYLSS